MDRSNIFETPATNQSVPTPSPRQAGSPLFSSRLTPTKSQRVSFRLLSENEGSESNSFTEFSGLEIPTYPPPELNSTGCKNRTSPQHMPFQQIVSQPVIAIELPMFWENDIPLWFTTIENTFCLRNIYNETQRYELLLTALDLRHLQKLEHVLADIDRTYPYSHIREEIFNVFAPSVDRRLDELLYDTELGDRKLTELLHVMKKLMGTDRSHELLKSLLHLTKTNVFGYISPRQVIICTKLKKKQKSIS